MREVVSQCPYFIGQSHMNRGGEDRKSRVMSSTQGEARFMAKLNLNTGSAQYEVNQKIYNNRKAVLGGCRFPATGSKIIIFFFINNSFCAAGEIRTG